MMFRCRRRDWGCGVGYYVSFSDIYCSFPAFSGRPAGAHFDAFYMGLYRINWFEPHIGPTILLCQFYDTFGHY